ncbi:MAG: RIO1 family regulatory kinase/ATPase [Pseudomonadota bacterium]
MRYRDYEPHDLQRAGFKIHQLAGLEIDNIENAFVGVVRKVLGQINDGKEATVYLCAMDRRSGVELGAAKIFKSRNFRHFDTDRNYRNFNKIRNKRDRKHLKKRGGSGDRAFHFHWVKSEWDTLSLLHDIGVRVPRPMMHYEDGILMEFIGSENGAAPRLINCKLNSNEVSNVAERLRHDIGLMLENDVVHGDLSPYNILYDGIEPVIIDVPQAMPFSTTPNAYGMAHRDLSNLDRYFEKQGLTTTFVDLLNKL